MSAPKMTEVISQLGVSTTLSDSVVFRDGGNIYLHGVKRPTFLYDKRLGVRMKYGEYNQVEEIRKSWEEAYRFAGFHEVADDLAVLEVPPNQELVDLLFQSSGVFKDFVQQLDNLDR